jgi:hypothetical protein
MRNILIKSKKVKAKGAKGGKRKKARLTQYLPPELVNYTKEFTPEQIAGKSRYLCSLPKSS